jgi:hypothetical protein
MKIANEGFVVNILYRRCQNEKLMRLRTMAYCSHSRVLSLLNTNTQCEMTLVRLRMRGLTPTYDVVAATVSPPLPSCVGQYKIIKLVRSRTIGLYE